MNCHPRDTTRRNVPRCEQRGTHNAPMPPLADDRRLMRITGLDRSPDPRLNTMNDADLLDLLARAREVRDRRRGVMHFAQVGEAAPPSTQADEPMADMGGR